MGGDGRMPMDLTDLGSCVIDDESVRRAQLAVADMVGYGCGDILAMLGIEKRL